MRILIAEDDNVTRHGLATLLEGWGYEVVNALDGGAALEFYETNNWPRLAILDWLMPRIDGVELCQRLRQRVDIYPYIILLTGRSDPTDLETALQAGVNDYIIKPYSASELKFKLRAAHQLISLQENFRWAARENQHLIASIPSILVSIDREDHVVQWNHAAESAFRIPASEAIGKLFTQCPINWDWVKIFLAIEEFRQTRQMVTIVDVPYTRPDQASGTFDLYITEIHGDAESRAELLMIGLDATERKSLESQLFQARRLEMIGQLSAGVAHEINTPMQFIGDNLSFLDGASRELVDPLKQIATASESEDKGSAIEEIKGILKKVDLDYLSTEIPGAITEALDGVKRVSQIVQAMKEYAHPGSDKAVLTDVNKAIQTAATLSRNEWKYNAEMQLNLDPNLPQILCAPGKLGQMFLNLIVNASHAIKEKGKQEKGLIIVDSALKDGEIVLSVSDSGTGIPEEHRVRIFEPFYTTKKVGQGTGQGLTICYDLVVNKLGGCIDFSTQTGVGTVFTVTIPLERKPNPAPDSEHSGSLDQQQH